MSLLPVDPLPQGKIAGVAAMTVSADALRWAVNVSKWEPSKEQWTVALECLPNDVKEKCLQYLRRDDQKRAVVSQLLQRACIQQLVGEQWSRIDIQRTKGNKPFYAGSLDRQHAPNFNYNVSHEGDYVVLACEGWCVCGVDVAAPQQLRRKAGRPLLESITLMKSQLSQDEWCLLQSLHDDESALEATFQVIWSCKEAFIKARGDGLGFEPLSRINVQLPSTVTPTATPATQQNSPSFSPQGKDNCCSSLCCLPCRSSVNTHQLQQQQCCRRQQQLDWLERLSCAAPVHCCQLVVDGVVQRCWCVFVQQLPGRHWVAVARGPPEAVVDAHGVFKSTLLQPHMTDQQLQVHLHSRSSPFDMLEVEDLLPDHVKDLYNA